MTIHDLCTRYLTALNGSDLSAIDALFTADATVVSPLYGSRPAHAFFAELFADTGRSETTLLNIFERADGGGAALHFRYVWTLAGRKGANGRIVSFECVDVFTLAADRQRFQTMTIIYDTAPLRADFEASRAKGI